ncbi:Alpha/Beta hydrolase protein [Ochromonadaceae sp. CCMP2298]|nr:Alpha/Beta hydrolase protein [Ochromonadaceae sp. CCMP2298]
MIKSSYNALVNAIIRPPRCEYDISKLGPPAFAFCGRRFVRRDFVLTNARGLKICCSMWEPQAAERPAALLPCVIYMHGNSSARLEALSSLSLVLSLGATLLAFDFAGSGMSEGEYVSLGYFEKDDLGCVIEHLRQGTTSTIALWGRSMGASTALLHGERDPSIASMVLDSAFHSLVMLAEEMVEMGRQQGLFAPGILVRMVLSFVRSSVQKAANFDIRLLRPIDSVDKCFVPALFVAALNDHFVSQKHSELLHAAYGGDKNLVIVDGDHNSPRPRFLYDSIGIFLATTLQIPDSWMLADCEQYIRRMPWAAPPASFQSQRRRFYPYAYFPELRTYFNSCTFLSSANTLIHSYTHTLIHSYTHTLIHSYTHPNSFGLSGTFAGPARGVAENNGNGGGGGSGGSGGNGGGDAEMEAMLRMHMCEGAGAEGAAEMSLDDLMAISVLVSTHGVKGGVKLHRD